MHPVVRSALIGAAFVAHLGIGYLCALSGLGNSGLALSALWVLWFGLLFIAVQQLRRHDDARYVLVAPVVAAGAWILMIALGTALDWRA